MIVSVSEQLIFILIGVTLGIKEIQSASSVATRLTAPSIKKSVHGSGVIRMKESLMPTTLFILGQSRLYASDSF
jgi:hypothetical protein